MATTKPTELAIPTTTDGIRNLLQRAAKGDTATLPAIRKLLENPANIDYFGGNLAKRAQWAFLRAMAGEDLAVQEAISAKLTALRKELLGENPTPVEVLLVERIVACWLQVQDADIRAGQATEPTFRQAEFHQHRMDATNRRYLAALKALALVRKLAVPVFQLNVARKQVNIVTPTTIVPTTGV